jgi:23S rRNA (uridine2552-2'-O)-methyltransferase
VKHSKSSSRWLQEHASDQYVKAAKEQGYRSRAAFKLMEIQKKHQFIKIGHTVVDLGAAPGGWSQVVSKWVGDQGRTIALDILPMLDLPGVEAIQGDFTEEDVYHSLLETLGKRQVDVVLSDMAPNMCGVKSVDQDRSFYLAELAADFAKKTLNKRGVFLIKLFQGVGFEQYIKELRVCFEKVSIVKPDASRARSREYYVIAKGCNLNFSD